MQNDRPIEDPRTQEALGIIAEVYRLYDLAGGAYVVNAKEMAFHYALYTTWNAVVEDDHLPQEPGMQTLGFRIRVKQEELGPERAKELLEGTAWMLGAMKNFGMQCTQWATDMMRMLRKAGIHIEHTPFGGQRLPHIGTAAAPRKGRR
jgi:hypothetical protein